jgi:hypothetical protein
MPPARVRRLRDTEIAAVFEESLLTRCLPHDFQTFRFAAADLEVRAIATEANRRWNRFVPLMSQAFAPAPSASIGNSGAGSQTD